MRRIILPLMVAVALLVTVSADPWDSNDYEIFRLKDELDAHEGPGTTFYDFLGISPSATQDEIGRAYRKRSRQLHPDKAKASYVASKMNPAAETSKPSTSKDKSKEKKDTKKKKKPVTQVRKQPSEKEIRAATKVAEERFTRLGLIAKILRGEGRERYDHFLNNGFPKWRGTGYYYQRYRPGAGTTILGLFIFAGGLFHYVALVLGYRRQKEFMEGMIKRARREAWGEESAVGMGIPGLGGEPAALAPEAKGEDDTSGMNRRQKRLQMRESKKKEHKRSRSVTPVPGPRDESGNPQGARRKVVADNGKVFVVDSQGSVWLEEEDDDGKTELFLLDPNDIHKPAFRDTVLVRLPKWVLAWAKGKFSAQAKAKKDKDEGIAVTVEAADDSSEEDWETIRANAAEEERLATEKVANATSGPLLRKKRGKIH